jgi:hypothetical protein
MKLVTVNKIISNKSTRPAMARNLAHLAVLVKCDLVTGSIDNENKDCEYISSMAVDLAKITKDRNTSE